MDAGLIAWREDFRIGLPEVDQEHRELIDSINRLHRELVVGASIARVTGALGDIHAAISAHFALEEKDMQALHYGEFEAHKNEHERLLDDILDIVDDVTASGSYDPKVLSARLAEWFTGHFKTFDARLHRWLAARH